MSNEKQSEGARPLHQRKAQERQVRQRQTKDPSSPKTWRRSQKDRDNRPFANPMELIPRYTRAVWSRLEQLPSQRGLRRRWLLNSVGVILVVAVLAVILLSMAISNYYYSSMQAGLESSADSASSFISSYSTNQQTYLEMAGYYINDFKQASNLNLQFINTDGQVVRTSYAISGNRPGTRDITDALSTGVLSCFTGRDPSTGERIMAVSSPIISGGDVKGVIRLVTSCAAVDLQILLMTCVIILAAIFIVILMYFLSLYFIQSIIIPVNSITQIAKRIAAGSYGIQVEKQYEDEIGDLVNAINDMSTKISESERTKNEFISSVSHELRTPLTAINGWSQTLLSGELADQESRVKGLQIIASEGQRLSKMVEELLDFSRIEDGRFTLNIEPVDIKAELEDAVFTYRQFFREKNLRLIHHDCEEEFPPIPGDPARLRQVFSNLLDNAGKYGADGGQVDTYIDRDNGMVRIRVRDHGPGVPEAALPHVKEKFYRASATSTKIRGSGIGLSVCDEIITRLGGTLEIANAEGGGCEAMIHLPMTTPAVKPASLREALHTGVISELNG